MKFWENVNNQLDHIEAAKPNTAWHLIQIMNEYRTDYGALSSGEAFFEGSGGNRSLFSALRKAGWEMILPIEAGYYWAAQHPDTGDIITYVEGDVFADDQRILN